MPHTVEELREQALRLPIADRARLATELISSLDNVESVDQAKVEAAWAAEVQRRVYELRIGRVETVEGPDVLKEARRRLEK